MNPLIADIPPSLIRTIAAKKRSGDIDLGLGEPVLPPDLRSFEAALEWTRRKGSPYSPNAGFTELREAIAEYVFQADSRRPRESGDPAVVSPGAPTISRPGESRDPAADPTRRPRESGDPAVASVFDPRLDPGFRRDDVGGSRDDVRGSRDDDAGRRDDVGGSRDGVPGSRDDDAGRRDDEEGAANVCVTIGSEEALYLAIKTVVDPARHEVLIVEPCYLAYPKLCMLEGVRHRMVALSAQDQFRPSAATVLEQLRPDTRLIILNTPSNPTGRIWPEAELRRLSEGLAARGGEPVFVLADEVYREIYHDSAPPYSIAHCHPHTLVAGSLSKSSSLTGLRLGWLAGPTEVIADAVKVHQFVNTAASTFSQRVAMEIFDREGELSRYRRTYAESRRRLVAAAGQLGLELIPPEGAFYGFIRLPEPAGLDSLAFCERLIEKRRVVTVPGRAFGESGEGWVRISWVGDPETVEEGLRRMKMEMEGSG